MGEDRILKNCMEQLVREYVEQLLREGRQPKAGMCTCPRCVLDVEMEALNRLPSFYVACSEDEASGECHARKAHYHEDIAAAVARAMEIVSKRGHIEE